MKFLKNLFKKNEECDYVIDSKGTALVTVRVLISSAADIGVTT